MMIFLGIDCILKYILYNTEATVSLDLCGGRPTRACWPSLARGQVIN